MLTKSTTLIITLFLCQLSFSQQLNGRKIIDSLLTVSFRTKEPKQLTDVYNQLSRELRDFGKQDSSVIFSARALQLAEKLNYKKGKIEAHLYLGNAYRELNELPKAKKHIELLLSLCDESKYLDKKGDGYDNLGHIYFELKDSDLALEYHLKSLKIREKIGDKHSIGNSNDNIAHIYSSQSNFPKALQYFSESLQIFKAIGDEKRIPLSSANTGYQYYYIGNLVEALSHFNEALKYYTKANNAEGIDWMKKMISFVYSELGNYDKSMTYYFELLEKKNNSKTEQASIYLNLAIGYMEKLQLEKAHDYFSRSLKLSQEEKNSEGVMLANFYIGTLNYRQKNIKEALRYYLLSHDDAEKINSIYWKSVIKERIGRSYYDLKNYNEATKWINEGFVISEQIMSHRDISEYYLILSKLDSVKGNYRSSLENYKKHIHYDKIIQKNEANKLVYQLEFNEKEEENRKKQLEKEKKAKEELSIRKSERNTAVLGFTIVSLFLIIVLYLLRLRNKKIKAERQNIELKQKEIEIVKETERFKSRFLANISHEFRTPLTLINGNIDLLKKQTPENIEKLDEISRNGEQVLNLINQLLDLSKMESGQYILSYASGNLLNDVMAYISAFNSYAETENITFTINTSEQAKKILSDKQFLYSSEAIQAIINNLLSNAIKFTPNGGSVITEVDFDRDVLTLKVTDTGPGIPEQDLSKVFDRFYQVEEIYDTTQKGSGIGLALVKEFAILHDGDVIVNNNLGGGCTFTVWFTCKQSNVQNTSTITFDKNKQQPVTLNQTEDHEVDEEVPLILVVEDQPELRKFIVENIGNGYQCLEAENGKIGCKLAEQHIPDLIISDVMMPEMNGFDFCRTVKENVSTSHIPVILLTAKADKTDRLSGLELGADDYMLKPFSVDELKLKVRNFIRLQQSLRNKFKDGWNTSQEEIHGLSDRDRNLLSNINDIIRENIPNSQFSVVLLADTVHLSQSQLTRKLKAITGQNPSDLIKAIRLNESLKLLKENKSVSDVSWMVGFEDPAYFGKAFRKHFGKAPSKHNEL